MGRTYICPLSDQPISTSPPPSLSLSLSTSGLQPWASTINAVIKKEAEREEACTRLESALYLSFHPSLSHNPPTIMPKCFHWMLPSLFSQFSKNVKNALFEFLPLYLTSCSFWWRDSDVHMHSSAKSRVLVYFKCMQLCGKPIYL